MKSKKEWSNKEMLGLILFPIFLNLYKHNNDVIMDFILIIGIIIAFALFFDQFE